MEILTGILFDVSRYPKGKSGGEVEDKNLISARSIFEVIKHFLKYDESEKNCIFTIGVGFKYGKGIFDVLETIELFNNESVCCCNGNSSNVNAQQTFKSCISALRFNAIVLHDKPLLPGDEHWTIELARYNNIVENIFQIAERNGAKQTRKWVLKETIQSAIPYETASLLLSALTYKKGFVKEFVSECLPLGCKTKRLFIRSNNLLRIANHLGASTGDVIQIVENAMGRLLKDVGSVFSVKRASEILHGCIDFNTPTEDRIKRLIPTNRPLRCGRTPLSEALKKTTEIFQKDKYLTHKKLLFVFSDGDSTDTYLASVFERLKNLKVTVVCFLINSSENIKPLNLFSHDNHSWSNGTKCLFSLSSIISSNLLPRSIFYKTGWNIDITNNQTKLFLQIKHHRNIHDVCSLVRHVVTFEDSLSNYSLSDSLDMYINQNIDGFAMFTAQEQVGETCYAHASATIIHLSVNRIYGRVGGYPNFDDLKAEIINLHGTSGADTLDVLKGICPNYRLHCEVVDINEAMRALAAKRQVVARFRLTDLEWDKFSKFFEKNPTGILTKADIGIYEKGPGEKRIRDGHAVVFTDYDYKFLRFCNSWGNKWADNGFFKVQNSEVLNFTFIDVYWTLKDLFPKEIDYFEKHGCE